jgi:hypothetical protein
LGRELEKQVTYTGEAHLYVGGQNIGSITLMDPKHQTEPTDVMVNLGNSILTLPPQHANTLVVALMTRLFDDGTMTMETAERVGYLSSAVLADSDMHRGLVSNGPIGPLVPLAVAEFIAEKEQS